MTPLGFLLTTTTIVLVVAFFLSSGAFNLSVSVNTTPHLSSTHQITTTGFEIFLQKAFNDYPAWLQNNRLDPLQENQKIFNFSYQNDFVNLTGRLWNDTFQGHSTGGRFILSKVNLLAGTFKIERFGGNLSVYGDYEVEGSILFSGVSVRGAGQFGIRQWKESNAFLEVKGFGLTPEGFIDFSKAEVTNDQNVYLKIDYFEGLEAGGHEKDMENLIFRIYDDAFDFSAEYRMTTYILRYLKELFAKTNIATILATAPIPFTTIFPNL